MGQKREQPFHRECEGSAVYPVRAGLLGCVAALLTCLVFVSSAAAECPNETLRRESNPNPVTGQPYSAALRDCRAYEVVSPLYKQEQDAEGISVASGSLAVAADGDTTLWGSIGAFSNPENIRVIGNVYRSQRGASGWSTLSAFAPSELVDQPLGGGSASDSSPDLRSAQVSCGGSPLEKGQGGTERTFTLECARREGTGSWTSTPTYTYVDAGSHLSFYVGGSSDLTRVFLVPGSAVFSSDTVPGPEPGIYEIAGCCTPSSRLRLVNVDVNGEELDVLHAPLGGPAELEEPLFGDWRNTGGPNGSAYHAVSESAGTVFFTATPNSARPAESEILTAYARVNCGTSAVHSPAASCQEDREGREGEWFETVPVSNPSHEECNKCIEGAARRNATYQAASADGTKVFFTTTQELLDHDSSFNLYEYDFNGPEGEKLVLLSHDAAGAKVAGVVRTSANGGHVYFVAEGVLTEEPNGNGERAALGRDNLYGSGAISSSPPRGRWQGI